MGKTLKNFKGPQSARIFSIPGNEIRGLAGDILLEVRSLLAFDERDGHEKRSVGDFDGKVAVGVVVFRGDAVFGERAAGAGDRDAFGARRVVAAANWASFMGIESIGMSL